jgi:hypothetical protein
MRFRWIIPLVTLISISLSAGELPVKARSETIIINPTEVTPLHLRPGFISTIRMPEEVNSVALGSRGEFTADHNEAEPLYVYVKPITREPAQSNLVIATKSGMHVTLELISDGAVGDSPRNPVDFLLEYHLPHSSLISVTPEVKDRTQTTNASSAEYTAYPDLKVIPVARTPLSSALEEAYAQQCRVNAPAWRTWQDQQIEASLGEVRQWGNQTMVSFSILNSSEEPVEIVPPQVQFTGHATKKKSKEGKSIISDQLEIRQFKLSAARLEPGERVDGVVLFDRPSFKQSSERLFLQLAQANQIDKPVLIRLPFTPPTKEGFR